MKSLIIGMCIGAVATCGWIIILPGPELREKYQQMAGSNLIPKANKISMKRRTK